jgi:hypothetical protein
VARPGTFPKGQSGNPRGRPKKDASITDWIRYRLRQPVSDEDKRSGIQALADTALAQALGGDVAWAKLALDRGFGAVAQPITGADGGPILLQWAEAQTSDE